MYQTKTKGTAKALPLGLAIGALVSLIITLVGSAVLSHLMLTEVIGEEGIGYGSMVILLIGSIMGAWSAVSSTKRLRLQVSLLSAAVYYLILLGTTALLFGGQYAGMGVTAVIVLVGALVVAFFPGNGNVKIRFRKRPYR